ncbi:hypothetical protein AXJ10_gp39 [Gordonia phage GordTnk2]|uniref:Uncharacterized protein n=1 Tax=Gordonia phage GordTnk2 TaxID=1622192 RepID=A0A0E3T6G7_9CAUD|nr:hypothetical protein AXJ10_gp39 [Gordonia phage GordTnk2]AKC02779.1 hypothetical protein GordTnk2_39 [Gordonia phage GordTnk2]
MSDITDPASGLLATQCGLSPQPDPIINEHPSSHDLVCRDLNGMRFVNYGTREKSVAMNYFKVVEAFVALCESLGINPASEIAKRKEFGLRKYGTILQPFNGRDNIRDTIDELGDALVYMRAKIFEEAHELAEQSRSGEQAK